MRSFSFPQKRVRILTFSTNNPTMCTRSIRRSASIHQVHFSPPFPLFSYSQSTAPLTIESCFDQLRRRRSFVDSTTYNNTIARTTSSALSSCYTSISSLPILWKQRPNLLHRTMSTETGTDDAIELLRDTQFFFHSSDSLLQALAAKSKCV
jgi:hypothetical protein